MFGCPCFVHIDKQLRSKLDDRAWKGVFMGNALDSQAYLVWNPRTKRLVCSRNVEFGELAVVSSTDKGRTCNHYTRVTMIRMMTVVLLFNRMRIKQVASRERKSLKQLAKLKSNSWRSIC